VPARLSPVERIRAQIDQLFTKDWSLGGTKLTLTASPLYGQGYHFAKPLDVRQLAALLQGHEPGSHLATGQSRGRASSIRTAQCDAAPGCTYLLQGWLDPDRKASRS
jgi:hypothetical protein